ncbi:hypothetical protein SAMN02745126_02363 [Enhydrobacter aerosaccus]|uniref:Uncharacterized protein n=1 Tax=Enhydrobacter aerosaccus TaxID=225324 RepID=A0A1T4NMX6_9HYPH|nr:hypothetical protein [Enhydrobacter aerosaccus]SJZ80564.1 hypothetical protein SAMN02745126_02363 [Enhydrobacter aerosaccus]
MDEKDKVPTQGAEHGPLFEELRAVITKHTDAATRERLLTRLDHLETSVNSSSFGTHLKAFAEEAEEDAAAVAPFLSRLSSLLP